MHEFPDEIVIRLKKIQSLRYGENPHQSAALYELANQDSAADGVSGGIAAAKQLQGKELSYNNIQDADAALDCVAEFTEPACVIVKHMNPCGVAEAGSILEAYQKAYVCDTVSAFGGIVAINRELDKASAEEMAKIFLEVMIAPSFSPEALAVFAAKPNVRLLTTPITHKSDLWVIRSVGAGVLVQTPDNVVANEYKVVTKRAPTDTEMADLEFAYKVVKHVKSNAIVFVKDRATLGIGAGQMSRVYSAKIASIKAADMNLSLQGSVMASDAFFPFPDTVEAAHEAGATAIAQPGGSLKDQDSIDKADSFDMAMVFTGIRHFRH